MTGWNDVSGSPHESDDSAHRCEELPMACDACRASDESLRYSSHPYVISTITATEERLSVGLLCAACRGRRGAKAVAISLACGWWSLGGPAATVRAISVNLRGGDVPPDANAELHRMLADRRTQDGDPGAAARSLRVAQTLRPSQDTARVLWTLAKAGHKGHVKASPYRFAPVLPLASFAIVLVAAGSMIARNPSPAPATEASSAPRPVAAAPSSVPRAETHEERKARNFVINREVNRLELLAKQHGVSIRATGVGSRQHLDEMLAIVGRLREHMVADPTRVDTYIRARVSYAEADASDRIISGREIGSVQRDLEFLGNDPAVLSALKEKQPANLRPTLRADLKKIASRYRPGASVDAIQRTTGESFHGLFDTAVATVIAADQGDPAAGVLASEFDSRAESIAQATAELRERAAVLKELERAFAADRGLRTF